MGDRPLSLHPIARGSDFLGGTGDADTVFELGPARDDDPTAKQAITSPDGEAEEATVAERERVVLENENALEVAEGEDAGGKDFPEGGRGWWVVAGCAMISAVTIGFQLVWGVFQEYYLENVFPTAEPSVVGFLGSIPTGFMLPIAVVCGKLGDRYGYKMFVIAGCAVTFIGMLLAAFCTQLWQFFLTQGVLPAIGCGLVLPFIMAYPSQWFKRLRGLATGLVIAGSSFGGGVASLLIRVMLTHLGLRYTLLIYAFINLGVLTLGCLLLKSRQIPGAPSKEFMRQKKIVWLDRELLTEPTFWSAAFAMMFTCFGYPPPLFYLAEYAYYVSPTLSPTSVALPIAISDFASGVGRTLVGRLADRIGVLNAFLLAVIVSALSQLILWNLSKGYGAIMAFAVVFGFWGGCFISLAAPMGATLFGVHNLATLSSMLMLFNTPGNTAGASIFGAVLKASGNNWQAAISYSGAVQILGAISLLYARFKRQPKLFAVI